MTKLVDVPDSILDFIVDVHRSRQLPDGLEHRFGGGVKYTDDAGRSCVEFIIDDVNDVKLSVLFKRTKQKHPRTLTSYHVTYKRGKHEFKDRCNGITYAFKVFNHHIS